MAITSTAASLKAALEKSYANADQIEYSGKVFRRDIGWEIL